jgi:DMSO/TMAO reductase YedYZ heme-binding membrane subunit
MAVQEKKSRIWYLALTGVIAVLLVILAQALGPWGTPLSRVIRGAGMLGYLAVFLASLSSLYLRELVRFFGRPFIKVHHAVSITGLIMLLIHPLGAAWEAGSLAVFVPATGSWLGFLRAGGRPAWYLIGLAVLAAVLRKSLARSWRAIHYLNYVAFLLASAHASLLGSDFQHPVAKAVIILMTLVIIGVFIRRRTMARKAPGKR